MSPAGFEPAIPVIERPDTQTLDRAAVGWTVTICFSLLLFYFNFFVLGATAPQCARAVSFTRFLDHTQRRTTFGMTPLDE